MINLGLIIAYILFGLALIGSLAFPILYMIKHPKEAKMTFLGIGGMVIIFLLSWLISSSEVTEKYTSLNINASQSKLIGAGFITAYIISVIAVIVTVGSQIKSIIVNK